MNLRRNRHASERKLEIGPGKSRIPGFETLNIVASPNADYVVDASKPLPFADSTFEVIYASHVLEHFPWYQTDAVLNEWSRVLAPGGQLEIWVPDGLRICKALVDFECQGDDSTHEDGWYRHNEEEDVCKWASGRVFSYGDWTGRGSSPNWHRALFTPSYLQRALTKAGLTDVRRLSSSEVRGYDHGWINLGMCGTKA